jgi:hypothetical protein
VSRPLDDRQLAHAQTVWRDIPPRKGPTCDLSAAVLPESDGDG